MDLSDIYSIMESNEPQSVGFQSSLLLGLFLNHAPISPILQNQTKLSHPQSSNLPQPLL